MTSHLDQHKAELEKLCSFLKDAISKAARRKHRLCCSVQREEPAMTVETPQGIVDLSEIDSLLAKARTVRIDVDKCDKHHTERKKEIKDSSKKRIGIVDLSEIDSLLAKARTVRIDVDKCDKHHTERKKEIKDSSKKRIGSEN
eukprot:gene9052-10019_t